MYVHVQWYNCTYGVNAQTVHCIRKIVFPLNTRLCRSTNFVLKKIIDFLYLIDNLYSVYNILQNYFTQIGSV